MVSILGNSRLYVVMPQNYYNPLATHPTASNFCPTFWVYNVRNTYTFLFQNTLDATKQFNCQIDDLDSAVLNDQVLYLAVNCPIPPTFGSYLLKVGISIPSGQYFTSAASPSTTDFGWVSNWQDPDAVTVQFTAITTPFITSINAVEGDSGLNLNVTTVAGIALTSQILSAGLTNAGVPPTSLCSLPISPLNLIYNQESSYICQTPSGTPGGLYNYSQLTARGYSYALRKTSFWNYNQQIMYNVAIHPIVQSISPSSGFSQGQYITVNGQGFSSNISQVNASYDGYPCSVQSTSFNSLTCLLSLPTTAPTGSTFGSAGLLQERFPSYSKTLAQLALDSTTTPSSATIVETPETLYTAQSDSGFFQRFTSYFDAPQTGIYRFSVAANSATNIYIASSGNLSNGTVVGLSGIQTSRTSLVVIGNNTSSQNYRDFSNAMSTSPQSLTVSLVKGQSYLLTIVQDSTQVGTYMTLGVEIPSTVANANSIAAIYTITTNYNYPRAMLYQSWCASTGTGYNWNYTDWYHGGNISFALVENTINASLFSSSQYYLYAPGAVTQSSIYNPMNPDTVRISAELTAMNGGRRINVTSFPVNNKGFIPPNWAAVGGYPANLYWQCSNATGALLPNGAPSDQAGWGLNIYFLDPLPASWYNPVSNNSVFAIVTTNLNGTATGVTGPKSETVLNGSFFLTNPSDRSWATSWETHSYYNDYIGDQIVQGFWNFTFNGTNSGNLSYNIDAFGLRDVFRTKFNLFVTVSTTGWPESGYTWQITFDSVFGDVSSSLIQVNGAGLTVGGTNKTKAAPPTLSLTKTQTGRTSLFLAPVPTEFLQVPASSPQFVAYSGGVRSHTPYSTTTSYSSIQSPTITAGVLTPSTNTINFTVSYPTGSPTPSTSDLSTFSVTVDGFTCTVTQFYSTGFICTLPSASADPSPGPITVTAYWPTWGFYATSSPLILTDAPSATITGVSPTNVSLSGGSVITVTGTGFGSISNTYVTLDGVSATVTFVNSTTIVFTMPNLTSVGSPGAVAINIVTNTISLTANGLSTYQTTAATIVSLNTTSITPVSTSYIKGTLSNNPDTSLAHYTAKLVSNDGTGNPNIQCYLFVMQSTSFICAVAGGLPGTYQFILTHATLGNSHQTPTITVGIFASSVSPASGSWNGGTAITIQGQNFSPVLNQNQVYIGADGSNSLCTVTAATSTQITCQVAAIADSQTTGTAYAVRVFGRLQQEATYTSTLTFTYVDSGASILSVNGTFVLTGDVLQLTGTKLTSTNGGALVLYLNNTQATISFSNDTAIQFTVPQLTSGIYYVNVLVPNYGYVDAAGIGIDVPLVVSGLSYAVANAQGNRLVINGNGFSTPDNITIQETNATCSILAVTPTQITCDLLTTFANTSLYTLVINFDGLAPIILPLTVNITQTPSVSSVTSVLSGATTTITVNGHNFTQFVGTPRLLLSWAGTEVEGTVSTVTNSSFISQFTNLPAATYNVAVLFNSLGYALLASGATTVTVALQTPASQAPQTVSFAGKSSLTYIGSGFQTNSADNDVRVCGLPAYVVGATSSSITFNVPPIVTPASQSTYGLAQNGPVSAPIAIGSNPSGIYSIINDGLVLYSYSDTSQSCQVGLDFGANTYVAIESITIYPDNTLSSPASLSGAQILGGNTTSPSNLVPLVTLDSTLQVGSNTFTISGAPLYRYVIFSGAYCRIAELTVNGIHYAASTQPVTSTTCNLDFYVGGVNVASLANEFTVSSSKTLTVTGVSPTEGPSAGGTPITITGTNFGSSASNLAVLINGISCVNVAVNSAGTQITCTTGYAANYPAVASFAVQHSVYGKAVIETTTFSYEDRWSNYATWGQLPPPTAGDIVYVPAGQRLLVDSASAINIVGFEIEGTVIFEDARDYQVTANWIFIRGGTLQIGSQSAPFQHKVQITLTGETQDVQLPSYGNKVLGVRGGNLLIYGTPKTTWSTLTTTASANATQITVGNATGWKVGDKIVISSTGFDGSHYDTANIVTISGNVITIDTPLTYSHYSAVETYSTGSVRYAAEVGVLTRNILIQGDSFSDSYNYGAHILITQISGPAVVVLQYVELYRVGQRGQKNRFPVNLFQLYDAPNSVLIGCAIHHSYNRGVRILQTSYLQLQNNVLFDIVGHGFYLESSTEAFNNFEGNLVLGIQTNYFFETTDLTPAAYYITNPQNFFSGNVAAGSTYYGFAFSVQNNPKVSVPSINLNNVCPQGSQLGLFQNNIAHSNGQEGLWIWPQFTPQSNPCGGIDWVNNPAVTANFTGFLAYKHAVRAIYLYAIGDVRFNNLTLLDNSNEGFFVNYAGYTPDNTTQINNSLIVAYSIGNVEGVYNSKGISVPASENFVVSNIVFVNFTETTMAALTTCTGYCWDGQARTFRVWGLTFNNVLNRLIWRAAGIFKTEDTSLSGTVGWSVPNQTHNLDQPYCQYDANLAYTITCNSGVVVRRIKLYQITPGSFGYETLRVLRLQGTDSYLSAASTSYTDVPYDYTSGAFTAAYVLGFRYHVHWNNGTDFNTTYVGIESTRWSKTDPNVILEFNHTDPRELYDVYVAGVVQPQFPNGTLLSVSNSSLLMGNYTHDQDTNLLRVAINYENYQSSVQLNAIICRYTCPPPPTTIQTDGKIRYWSQASSWDTTGAVPVDGDVVTIPSTWLMYLDTVTANLASLEVNGILQVLDVSQGGPAITSINTYNMWVHGGIVRAGTQQSPVNGNFAINLLGDQTNAYQFVDAEADSGSKVLAVTGTLELYGQPLDQTVTSLTAPASAGSSTLNLANATALAIAAGDTLVVGATGFNPDESEIVTVSSVSGNQVGLTSALKYSHFGGSKTSTSNANLNINFAAQVGKLNRNVQINGGSASWGGRLYVTDLTFWQNNPVTNQIQAYTFGGSVTLSYVELVNMGQDAGHAGVHFDTVVTNPSIIVGSSQHGGSGWGIHVLDSTGVFIGSTVIVYPVQHAIYVDGGSDVQVTNNLVAGTYNTGLIAGDVIDLIASIYSTSTSATISGNAVTGSEGIGLLFVADSCNANPAYIGSNSVNSAQTGVIATASSNGCIQLQNLQVFHSSNGGINTYAAAQQIQASNLVLTDNVYGSLNLNIGGLGDVTTASITLSNSYIGGTTYRTLDNTLTCTNISGIHIPVATIEGNSIPYITWQQPYWSVFDEALFATTFNVNQVEFANFADTTCSGLFALETNPYASDASAVTTLTGVVTTNVVQSNFVNFATPDPSWVNDTICGNFECSGLSNTLIKDNTGLFGNAPGSYIPNVAGIVASGATSVSSNTSWTSVSYGVLAFDSLDSDNFTRLFSPITITPYSGASGYNNTLNSFADHQYFGDGNTIYEGLQRLSRFSALVEDSASYNLVFTGTHPNTTRYELVGSSNYVVVKTTYETPLLVTVSTSVGTVNPNILKLGQGVNLASQNQLCGANNYYTDTRTIEFVLKGTGNCLVTVQTQDSLYVTIRYQTTVDQFFSSNGPASFIDQLAALVGVPTYNVRVVNVVVGSAIVSAYIPVDGSQQAQDYANTISNGVNNGAMDIGDMSVLDMSYSIYTTDSVADGSTGSTKLTRTYPVLSKLDIALIVIGVVAFIFSIVVGVIVYRRIKRRMLEKKPSKADWASINSSTPPSSDRYTKDNEANYKVSGGDIQGELQPDLHIQNFNVENVVPPLINEEYSPDLKSRKRFGSVDLAARKISLALNDSFTSNQDLVKRSSDEEKANDSMMAENFLKDLKQYETNQSNSESNSPLYKNIKRGSISTLGADKFGEPKRKSQFGLSIGTSEKRFSTLKRVRDTEPKANEGANKDLIQISNKELDVQDLESPALP